MVRAHPEEEYERLHKALLVLPFSKKVKVPSGSGEKVSVPTGMGVTRQLFPEQADLEIRDIIRASIETHAHVKLPEEKPSSPSRPRPIELLDEDTSTNLPGTQLKAHIASKHSKANLTPPVSVLTPEATRTGTSGYVNRCLGGPTPGLASLERPQQVPQR